MPRSWSALALALALGHAAPALASTPEAALEPEATAVDTGDEEVEEVEEVEAVVLDDVAAVVDAAADAEPDAAPPQAEVAAAEPPLGQPSEDPPTAEPGALVADEAPGDGEAMDPKLYAAYLREIVAARREAVIETIAEKAMAKQLARMDLVSALFSLVSLFGLVVLLSPLWLRKKYPNAKGLLWKYSALAALLFVLTINLFSGVLAVLRTGQMVAGSATNPQVQIVEATFEVIDEKAEDMAPMGPVIIEPTLAQLDGSSEEPLPVLLLQNVQKLKQELSIFGSVANFFKGVSWIFGYVPIVLSLVTVALFVMGLRPTLTDIAKLPERAAAGEAGVARRVTMATLRRLGREIATTLVVMLVLLVVMLGAGALLAQALQPAIEAFLAYLMVSFLYVQVVPDASSTVVLVSLGGTVLFLVLDLAVVIMASALFIGKTHRIVQRRFHDKEPLRAHARFWTWGMASLVWTLAFPLLYILAAKPAVELLIEATTASEDIHWALVLTSGPVVLVAGFLVFFALLRGPRAIRFLAGYRVPKLGTPVALAQSPADEPRAPVRTGLTAPTPVVPVVTPRFGDHVGNHPGTRTPRLPTTRYGRV